MELLGLLLFALLAWLIVGPIVAMVQLGRLRRRVEELERERVAPLPRRDDSGLVKDASRPTCEELTPPLPVPAPPATSTPSAPPLPPLPSPLQAAKIPPPLPIFPPASSATDDISPPPPASATASQAEAGFSWERFVGVKLFAWIGGLALFFGIVFFVKYAFERDLVPPALRVTLGYLTAAALMAAGYWFRQRQAYTVLTQTLSATGILAFYGVTYAAHAWYHFPVFTTAFTFALMALITAGAFVTAARAKAEVVAVLGLAGGFLTPALVASGQDQPVILFAYIALLNLGLAALAWRELWWRLLPLGAAGTVLVEWGWRWRFFEEGGYANGMASWGLVAVFGGFALLFAGLAFTARNKARVAWPWWAVLLAATSALLLAFDGLTVPGIAERPFLLGTLLLMAATGWLAAAWWAERFWPAALGGALAVMLHLALWMTRWLTADLLPQALALNLGFGLLHLVFLTRLFQRGVPMAGVLPSALGLAMMLVMGLPLVLLKGVSWWLWPPFLLAGMMTLVLAVLTRKSWVSLLALVITLTHLLLWLKHLADSDQGLLPFLLVLGLATMAFSAGAMLAMRWLPSAEEESEASQGEMLLWLQQATLSLPYLLLAMVPTLLPQADSTLLLGAALVLSLAAVARSGGLPWLALSAWVGWTLVALRADPSAPTLLRWQIAVPMLAWALLWWRRQHYGESPAPLAAVGIAMSWALWQLHPVVVSTWPVWLHGLLPMLFGLAWVAFSWRLREDRAGLNRRALAAGLALTFITLTFPFQFDHDWLTLAWALQAAGLCWLFTRLPHDGLRLTGSGVALLAFLFYLLETQVLDVRSVPLHLPMGIWLLLSFGTGGIALLLAGHWLQPPHHRWQEIPLRASLFILGGSLLFLLLNLQIAHAFRSPHDFQVLIELGGNFARDMTYSIAWALFALALVAIGFWKQASGARYAGIGLLLLTLAKLFLHDLDQVGSIYRIAAFLAVAVIALGASFLYQRAGKPSEQEG